MRRTAEAGDRARREAELSRERQRQAREEVIRPLQRFDQDNHFAQIIRASLQERRRRE